MPKLEEIKLEGYSSAELGAFRDRVTEAIASKREEEKRELLEEIEKLAEQRGLSLEEVIGVRVKKGRVKKGRAKATPKYRNPKDAEQTWSGRGKHPAWVKEALAAGQELEDLAI